MRGAAPGKINLALAVGPRRDDGKHEVLTVYQRVALCDRIELEPAKGTTVEGFAPDTLVAGALAGLSARRPGAWRVRIEKRVPVAGGLGGGSSDAATALRLANATLAEPLPPAELHALAAELGADVPFFLEDGPQIGTADGTVLEPVDIPQDFWIVLLLPNAARKESTAAVYDEFDRRGGEHGWEERRDRVRRTLASLRRPRDLVALPPNDLASSPFAPELLDLGAFRADVTGAGPVVYGLFHHRDRAESARRSLKGRGRTWLTAPAWYG
jgi:4-diphosphocytidyl-2-C-methyl-D-erythritol kinase